jgi:hypothetical protein
MSKFLLRNLEVVGYMGVEYGNKTMPREIVSVFRYKEKPDTYIIPPYRIEGFCVADGMVVKEKRVMFLSVSGFITMLPKPRQAYKHIHRWLDDSGKIKTGPRDEMGRDLASIANKHTQIAERQFTDRKWERCIHHCEVARSASHKNFTSLIIQCAAEKLCGRNWNLTAVVGASYISHDAFISLVDARVRKATHTIPD